MRKSFYFGFILFLIAGCSAQQSTPEEFSNPSSDNSMYPYLYNADGELYMSWLTSKTEGSHSLKYATFDNKQWSTVNTIASDSTWFVNWADFPSIIADKNGPIAAHWLNLENPGPMAYDIKIATHDSAKSWNNAFMPHNDGTSSEHGFVSMIPWDNDSFLAVWLDGRQTEGRTSEEYYDIEYAMTLRGAIIKDNGSIEQRFIIDKSVCDCCPTSLIKSGDTAIVAYRNRTENEIRDIYTSRFNGDTWSQPEAVHDDNWEIGGCPVNGPKLAAEASSVVVAWHTAAQDTPAAKFAYSTDKGKTFGKPKKFNNDTSIGRVDAEIMNGRIYVSWMEKNNSETQLKVSTFDEQQQFVKSQTVATVDEARKTGFPQMEQVGNNLIFAWTNPDSAQSKIITKRISVN